MVASEEATPSIITIAVRNEIRTARKAVLLAMT
jgi:hypothetical protein